MRRTKTIVCDECGTEVRLTPTGVMFPHNNPNTHNPVEKCPNSGLRPLNPGGGSVHAILCGLPELGKNRKH